MNVRRLKALMVTLGGIAGIQGTVFWGCQASDSASETADASDATLPDSPKGDSDSSTFPMADATLDVTPDVGKDAAMPDGAFVWGKRFGEAPVGPTSADGVLTRSVITTDAAGNVFLAGTFEKEVTLGGASLVGNNDGTDDLFLAKFSAQGIHLWSRRFDGTDIAGVGAILVDTSGDILLTGSFGGSLDLGGGSVLNADGVDAFLARLDANGNSLWARRYGGAGGQGFGPMFAVGTDVIIGAGQGVNSSVDFGEGALTNRVMVVRASRANGDVVWARQPISGTFDAVALSHDQIGNFVLAGSLGSSVDWGNGASISTLGQTDVAIVKFDPNGNALWAKRFGNELRQAATAVAMEPTGAMVVAGNMAGAVDFGNGPISAAMPTAPQAVTTFLTKLDSNGNATWSKAFATTGPQFESSGFAVAIDAQGNIGLTGYSDCGLDFGGGRVAGKDGVTNLFIAKFGVTGAHLWSKGWAGTSGGNVRNAGKHILFDGSGSVLMTASFEKQPIDLGGGLLQPISNMDLLLAKFGP